MKRNVQAALQSLGEQWQRAVLSGMGVAVASIAIILLVSIGLGVQKDIKGQVEGLGVNLLIAIPGHVRMANGFNPNLGGQSWFTERHATELRKVPGVQKVALLTFAGGGVRRGKTDAYPFVIACTPEWFEVRPVDLESGRVFGPEDESEHVVVLGQLAKESLFEGSSALGQTVMIDKQSYRVVGVTREKSEGSTLFAMQSFQNVAYIPYRTLKNQSPNTQIDRIFMKTAPDKDPKALVDSCESVLGRYLDRQQFSVITQEDLLKLIYQVTGILGTLVVGLTSIALFVGGMGIMTVMLMSVGERRKEIGVRKAVGARSRDVFVQFLVESAVIALGGVTAGLVVSVAVCAILAAQTNIKPLVTGTTVATTFAVGLGVGCLFGILPAVRAARLDPVASLRME